MTNFIARQVDEMEANALGCLRKGNRDAAEEYLTKAIGYAPFDTTTARLEKALALCKGSFPNHAICVLDGHNYEGGATCLYCAKPLTTHSVRS